MASRATTTLISKASWCLRLSPERELFPSALPWPFGIASDPSCPALCRFERDRARARSYGHGLRRVSARVRRRGISHRNRGACGNWLEATWRFAGVSGLARECPSRMITSISPMCHSNREVICVSTAIRRRGFSELTWRESRTSKGKYA
jgi:hypothetical protein